MLRTQLLVALGMLTAVAVLLILATAPAATAHFAPPAGDDAATRLAFAAR